MSNSDVPVRTGAVSADGVFYGAGPMSDDFMSNLNRQSSGMAPAGAVSAPTMFNGSIVPVSMAREALGRHMDALRHKLSSAESVPDPYQFAGNGNPYLAQQIRQREIMTEMAVRELEQVRAELDRLGKLTDTEVTDWAVKSGHIGRSHNGGLVLV